MTPVTTANEFVVKYYVTQWLAKLATHGSAFLYIEFGLLKTIKGR